jgi:hypothetical protein
VVLEQRFGHLRAGAVSRAEEEHAWAMPGRARIEGAWMDDVEAEAWLERGAEIAQEFGATLQVRAVVGVAPVGGTAPGGDESGIAEGGEMVGDEILGAVEEFRQLADLAVAATQLVEEAPALLVGEELDEAERGAGCRSRGHSRILHQLGLIRQDMLM